MYYFSILIVALVFIWRMIAGFRKGLVREVISIIAMIAGGFCMVLILGAIGSYLNREIGEMIKTISVLFTICIIYRLVNVLMTSLKLVSKLPVIKGVDKLLGVCMGFLEASAIVVFIVRFIKEWGLQFISK